MGPVVTSPTRRRLSCRTLLVPALLFLGSAWPPVSAGDVVCPGGDVAGASSKKGCRAGCEALGHPWGKLVASGVDGCAKICLCTPGAWFCRKPGRTSGKFRVDRCDIGCEAPTERDAICCRASQGKACKPKKMVAEQFCQAAKPACTPAPPSTTSAPTTTAAPATGQTCAQRGCFYDGDALCQCDATCEAHQDCCEDKQAVCDAHDSTTTSPAATTTGTAAPVTTSTVPATPSAGKGACELRNSCEYDGSQPCQCDDSCTSHGDCCNDQASFCQGGSNPNTPPSPPGPSPPSSKPKIPKWKKTKLSGHFFAEGASAGDFNNDGHGDVVAGPYWYEGPSFVVKHELYSPPTPYAQDLSTHANNFMAFPYDMDGDGWLDVLVIDYPGKTSRWYENPGPSPALWNSHTALPDTGGESPTFTDITGDGKPEIVCESGGRYGYGGPNWSNPYQAWQFHAVTPSWGGGATDIGRYTHGMGVGDMNGDGKKDLLTRDGWWEHKSGDWTLHKAKLSEEEGGAHMYAYDVDGDGDKDVISSLQAHHGWGLSWFENKGNDVFQEHTILHKTNVKNSDGVQISQIHAIEFVDVNRDGLKDIVTGTRLLTHGADPYAEGLLYWFELSRSGGTVRWIPHKIDQEAGAGVQFLAKDINGDDWADVVVATKKGAWVFEAE